MSFKMSIQTIEDLDVSQYDKSVIIRMLTWYGVSSLNNHNH